MITTTYKCDRCGAESTDRYELDIQSVVVGIMNYDYGSNDYRVFDRLNRGKDMCRKCREEFGLAPTERKKDEPEKTYPTLEEMFREIMREEIQAATGAHI